MEKVIKELFETHPGVDRFWIASDGQAFEDKNKHFGEAHANSLEDKTLKPVNRVVFEKLEEIKEKIVSKGEAGTQTGGNTGTTENKGTEGTQDTGTSTGTGNGGAQETELTEKQKLQAQYLELYGKKPNNLLGEEKLKAAIAEKLAETK